MESVSRPPHRRKHSSSTTASSAASLKHPYDDVSFSGGGRSKFAAHDYAEIFAGSTASIPVLDLSGLDERVGSGGSRGSGLDYSNIFGGLGDGDVAVPYEELFSGAKKRSKTRIPTDAQSSFQESGSQHFSVKTEKPSTDVSDQTTGEIKQHFNMSFNKTSQRNIDAPNGETHIAELHAVPGFTYFVNGTPPKKEGEKHKSSIKREVSRTWSFSAGVEDITFKGGFSRENSPLPDKSSNLNDIKLKSHISNLPPSPSLLSDPNEKKDERRSRLPNFASKDASDMTAGEYSAPLFDEDLDENSVAALSAAALKKAVEQAQESIRIAKTIMERKKEGLQDGLISRSKTRLKNDKKIRIDHEADGPKQNNPREPSERVRENFGAAKEHGDAFAKLSKKFEPSSSQIEKLYIAEKVELGNVKQNVEANEACRHATNITGLVAKKEDNFIVSTNKPGSHFEEMKTRQQTSEQKELAIHQPKGPENVAERVEKVVDCSTITQEQDNIIHESSENLRISEKDVVTEERLNVADDKGECEKKFVEHEKMVNGEDLTELKSEINNLLNESGSLVDKNILKQEDMEKKSENDLHVKSSDKEEKANLWLESELHLKEPIGVEISETEPEILPEIVEKVNEVREQKIDLKKLDCGHDGDEQILGGEYEQNETEEIRVDTCEFEAAENNIHMEANICAEVEDSEVETEENKDKFEFQETASEKDIDEAVDELGNDSGVSDTHSNDSSTMFSETQEHYDVDLYNEAEECQEGVNGCKENDSLLEVIETFSDKVNEMSETDGLRRCASEENFTQSELNNAFDVENVGLMEEPLPKDEDTSKTAGEVHNAAEVNSAKINMQNLPEIHTSNIKAGEFDHANVMEGASENKIKEGYLSTSIHVNTDEVSTQESQECSGKAKDHTSSLDTTYVESESVNEQNERVYSENQSDDREPKETDKSMETERQVVTDRNTEQKDSKGNERKSEADDQQQRIEAIKRGREREKDRIAVERAIREARERAFAEARERAERAAVEKAAAEARQRAMAEAREKEKLVDKASTEAKLRAERAAVERATAEARERALEKARSQKTSTETRTHAERYTAERFSSSSRSSGLKHSYSSSDLEKIDGSTSESAQRRKARLERHQRIMERAAKALAEKNMRDFLAQKEQAERNRLAESLDADIKRWATGKESNLRALLSTLQYILGADSGWQAIPLTEIITTAAVKKAYRKATLCVHPDKLQQRGASIQQKYICEKVFDLLKAAWNRFNSEER